MQSKRAIFALHRGVNDGQGSSREDQLQKVAESGFQSLHHIRKNLVFQFTEEVSGEIDYWLNQRSISPGLQEYVEAVSYAQYLSTGQLITYKDMLKWLSDDDGTLVYNVFSSTGHRLTESAVGLPTVFGIYSWAIRSHGGTDAFCHYFGGYRT